MAVSAGVARAAAAIQGGTAKVYPRPVSGGIEAKTVQAAAAAIQGGTNVFDTGADAQGRERIRIGTVGGTVGTYVTVWTAKSVGNSNGTYDGLRDRI